MNDRLQWWEDLPLGLALLAQSYVVGLWYFASIRGAAWWSDLVVAVGAGLALDLIVVTTVMGRRAGRSSGWSWATSFGAFGCSALIALDRYGWEYRSLLHVAFPLVVFLYSQHLAGSKVSKVLEQPSDQALVVVEPQPLDPGQALGRSAGFVYIFQSESAGCKIGCARDVDERFRQIATPLPFALNIVHTIATDDMYATEARMHRYFDAAGKRMRGEWFKLTSVDISTLKAIPSEALDQALEQALELLSAKGLKSAEFDGAFWLQQVSAQPQAVQAPERLTLVEPSAYACPHCKRPLKSKQARGAAVANGYCPACKAERKVA